MRELTADTIIRVRRPRPELRKRELTGDTRIRLSQIKDLLTWRFTNDQKDKNGKEHSEKNGQFVKQHEGRTDKKDKSSKPKRKLRPGTSLKPFAIEKTQTVVKRDAKGNIIDSSWEIKAGTHISSPEHIAAGTDIRDVDRLVRENSGTKADDWTKEKGVGIISPKKGAKKKNGKSITKSRQAELHWYKSDKTGVIEIKRTRWMD